MDKINSNSYDINGISTPLKSIKSDTSKINSSNDKENQYYDSNKKNYEEEKNKSDLIGHQSEPNYRNILQNKNFIPINTLSDKVTEDNINVYLSTSNNKNKNVAFPDDKKYDEYYPDNNNNINQSTQGRIIINNIDKPIVNDEKKEINDEKRKSSDKEDSLSNGLNLDEQNIKIDCEKIESEINKLNMIQKDDSINIKISKIIEENKNQNENRSSYRFSLKSDLFCYSEEEDDKKNKIALNNNKESIISIKQNLVKEEDLKKESKLSNNDKIIIIENKEDIEDKDKDKNKDKIQNNVNKNEKNIQSENINKLLNVKIDKNLLQKVEYGIDESGNPFNIKNYFEELKNSENKNNSNENKIKSPIAFIIPLEDKGKNYLIDLSGKIIPKMDDGYFNYQHDNIRILIKDFDVQHPSLRVFGTRKFESLTLNDEEEEGQNKDKDKDKDKEKDKKEKTPLEVKKLIAPIKNKFLVHNTSFNILSHKQNNNNFIDMQKANLYRNLLKANKTSPIILKNNDENLGVLSKDEQFSIWKSRYSPLTYERDSNNTKYSTKEMFYRKIPSNYSNEDSINLRQKNEDNNNNALNRTSKILNKSATANYFKNRSYLNNSKIITNSNIKKINLSKSDFTGTVENSKSLYNDSKNDNNESNATSPKEIKNFTCTSSRINLYNYKKLNKKRKSFNHNYNYYNYNRLINLKGNINKKIENQKQINFTNEKEKSINISKNNSNMFNESKIKKSQSSINIASTIDNISNNIKYIQNNIQKNLRKLTKSNSNEHIIRNNNYISTISSTNSESYLNYNTYNNEIAQSNRNNNYLENISINSNQNNFNKIMKKSINKNRGIITPSKKKYQCAILSKEVNDIISNYANSNPPKGKIMKKTVKKIGIYDYTDEIKNNTKKINSFLNGAKHRNKIISNNDKNLNQRYNHITESNNKSVKKSNRSQVLNSQNMKNNDSNNNNIYENYKLFNINNRERNIIINKEINNYNNNISEVISPIHSKYNINFYQKNISNKDNIFKIKDNLTEPRNFSNYSNKNQQNNRLNIINQFNSMNDINMIFNSNISNKYSLNTFDKKIKSNNGYFVSNNSYNYTERNYSNKNKIN